MSNGSKIKNPALRQDHRVASNTNVKGNVSMNTLSALQHNSNISCPTQIVVPFHNKELYIIEHEGQAYVPMKPIVEGMGLAWAAQTVKLNSNKDRWGVSFIETPTISGPQTMLCILLRKLPAWLYSIHASKVKPALRENVLMYQNECDDVLWEYWTKKTNARQRAQDELNRLHMEEAISECKGSFHGFGLYKRKVEKKILQFKISKLTATLQLTFIDDEGVPA